MLGNKEDKIFAKDIERFAFTPKTDMTPQEAVECSLFYNTPTPEAYLKLPKRVKRHITIIKEDK